MPYRHRTNRIHTNRIQTKRTIPMQKVREVGVVLLFCLLLPYVTATLFGKVGEESRKEEVNELFILAEDKNGREKIPLNTFLIGALAASMDTQMEDEALKAQAIILRSTVWEAYHQTTGREERCVPADELEQEYYSAYELKKSWRGDFQKQYERLQRLVEATDGMVMTYQGIAVKAPYFYVSAGSTRNGSEVYAKNKYPYLVMVESPQDRFCTDFAGSTLYPKRLFWEKIAALFDTEENSRQGLEELEIKRDLAGYVSTVSWQENMVSGEQFRKAFELPSSHFTLEQKQNGICITTQGIGHGLGLSQYGANEMAKSGKRCDEILKYYFHEIEILKY